MGIAELIQMGQTLQEQFLDSEKTVAHIVLLLIMQGEQIKRARNDR
ncbi:hypothetical protein [Flexithrix dorotheae]|nr:hypothetical protein [Flexithrix dorotheae]